MSLRTPSKLTLNGASALWTNQPAALTEFLGSTAYRTKVDLTDADQARLCVNTATAGFAGAVLGVQYSTDNGSTWTTAFSVPIDVIGPHASAWAPVPAAAKGDVMVRLGGQGGNATADPVIGLVVLEFYGVPGDFGAAGLVDQIVTNVYGLTRDMRDNAADYKVRITAGQDVATVAAVMKADASEYTRRLGWLTTAFANNSAACTAALALMGYTVAQAQALQTTLQTVATHTTNATLQVASDVNTEADFILANVPNYARLW